MASEKSVDARLAVLEEQTKVMRAAAAGVKEELSQLNLTVSELVSYARLSKRFVGIMVALGPTIGVVIAKLLQG